MWIVILSFKLLYSVLCTQKKKSLLKVELSCLIWHQPRLFKHETASSLNFTHASDLWFCFYKLILTPNKHVTGCKNWILGSQSKKVTWCLCVCEEFSRWFWRSWWSSEAEEAGDGGEQQLWLPDPGLREDCRYHDQPIITRVANNNYQWFIFFRIQLMRFISSVSRASQNSNQLLLN